MSNCKCYQITFLNVLIIELPVIARPPITSGPNTELRWRRIRPMILK